MLSLTRRDGMERLLLNAFTAFSLWWELCAQLYTLPVYLNWDLADPKQGKEFHSIRTFVYFGTTGVFKERKALLTIKLWNTNLPPCSSHTEGNCKGGSINYWSQIELIKKEHLLQQIKCSMQDLYPQVSSRNETIACSPLHAKQDVISCFSQGRKTTELLRIQSKFPSRNQTRAVPLPGASAGPSALASAATQLPTPTALGKWSAALTVASQRQICQQTLHQQNWPDSLYK